jgi:hypothetical protein
MDEIAITILKQLGGNKFIAMTGAKNFLHADVTESNPNAWLRMDLPTNRAKVNRLKITLQDNDTYTMHFYRMVLGKSTNWTPKISNEQTFDGVYDDMLQDIFTNVTGLDTHL